MNNDDDTTTGYPPLTDAGNAERMAAKYGSSLKYVKKWKRWLWWTGKHWTTDDKDAVVLAAKDTARSIRTEALGAPTEIYARISAWAARSENKFRLMAMISLAGAERVMARRAGDFDRDIWLMNCLNGTIELEEGNES